eukprot:6472765-Amphidinium_carterae.1
MRRPTHVHLTCEFSSALGRDLAANHWTVCASDVTGGPAVVIRENTLRVVGHDARTWTDQRGEWQLSVVVAQLEVVQAGDRLRGLNVGAMHVRNTVASRPDRVRALLHEAREYLEGYATDVCYVDGNQAAHVRSRPSSALFDAFAAPAWLRTSEQTCLFGCTQRQIDASGMCTGFLLNQSVLTNAVIWKHGLWQVAAADIGLRPRDEAFHLPSFLHLQAAGAATGWRRRSSAKQRERKLKYQAAAGSRRGAYKARLLMHTCCFPSRCFVLRMCCACTSMMLLQEPNAQAETSPCRPTCMVHRTFGYFALSVVFCLYAASAASVFGCLRQRPSQPASAVPMTSSRTWHASLKIVPPGVYLALFFLLVVGSDAVGYFPLTELDESTHLDLPVAVRIADQQRLRRQSIRTLEFHDRGTLPAPNIASVQELQVVAQCATLDEVPFTSQMIAELWDQIPNSDSSSQTLVDSNSFHSSDAGHDLSLQTLQRHILPSGMVRGAVHESSVSGPSPSQGPSSGADFSHSAPCRVPDSEAASAASPVSHLPRHTSAHSVDNHTSSGGVSPYNRWNELSDGCTSAATSSKGGLQPAELEKFLLPSGTKRKRGGPPPSSRGTRSSTSQSTPPPSIVRTVTPGGMSEYGDDPIGDFSESSMTPVRTSVSRPEDDDPIESFDVMRDLNATPLDTLSGADHDWIHGLPYAADPEPASLLAFSCTSQAAGAAGPVCQTAGAVAQMGVTPPLLPVGVLIQEVLTASTSEDEAPLTTLLTTRPGGISFATTVCPPSPRSPASAQGLSLLQLTTRWSRYKGVRVGEASTPGPHVFLEQTPIYTKEGQKGILTTKWRPQQRHWMYYSTATLDD